MAIIPIEELPEHGDNDRQKKIENLINDFKNLNDSGIGGLAADDPDEVIFASNFIQNLGEEIGGQKNRNSGFDIPNEIKLHALRANNPSAIQKLDQFSRKQLWQQTGLCQVGDLLGYATGGEQLTQAIRILGRKIFTPIPCFERMATLCRGQKLDPISEVWMISTFGIDKNIDTIASESSIDAIMDKLNDNDDDHGMIDAAIMKIPSIPGYEANIALYGSENESFLWVEEPSRHGDDLNTNYLYMWLGGMRVYRNLDLKNPLSLVGNPDSKGNRFITVEPVSTAMAKEWTIKEEDRQTWKFR